MLMDSQAFAQVEQLPVRAYRDEILRLVDANQVTILTAETGAGKSTQVPQYLAEHGYQKVIVTQPRILAARNLATRVREEYGWRTQQDAHALVGYRTAHERDDDPQNVILYCTDGLQLVRELTGSGTRSRQVLILDEIHEWNENMEVLLAWAKKRCQEDSEFRIVLMSATIETAPLAAYFAAPSALEIPGRSYGVTMSKGQDLFEEIGKLLESPEPHNVLVFLPGKGEIEQTMEVFEKQAKQAKVPLLPLHSQLELDEQQKVFAAYPRGKIILATNVAQTSITISDIDVVVDSGLERRTEIRNGVEGLFIAEISRADCLQRAGRAGRTKPGHYTLAQYDVMPCTEIMKRPEYGVPAIMRTHIDRLVLRLANIGIDIEDLEFYHEPSKGAIARAKRTLVSLGALSQAGVVTEIGRRMEKFPVESSYARMLVEAEDKSETVRSRLATIIAIQEVGGIVKGSTRYTGWRAYTKQTRSDLLAHYDVYRALPTIEETAYEDLGIIAKHADKAREVNERLNHELGLQDSELDAIEPSDEDTLLRCIAAGQLDQLWVIEEHHVALHLMSGQQRELSGSSVVTQHGLVAGTPFDLEVATPKGMEVLHLVNDVTAIDPAWLPLLAPDTFTVHGGGQPYFDPSLGTIARRTMIGFGSQRVAAGGTPITERSKKHQRLFATLYGEYLWQRLEHERRALKKRGGYAASVSLRFVQKRVLHIAGGSMALADLSKQQRQELALLTDPRSYQSRADERPRHFRRGKHVQDGHGHTGKHHRFRRGR